MRDTATKNQVVRALDGAAYSLSKTVEACSEIQDALEGLPDAFPVVARRLPILLRSLQGIEKNLKATAAGQETPEVKEKYGATLMLAEACQKHAGYLQDIFAAVAPEQPGEAVAKRLGRYREAVEDAEGDTVENVVKDLLKDAVGVAGTLLVSDDALVKELQEALDEVAKVKPSLKQDRKSGNTMISYGSGPQFMHLGRGNQNYASGGVQITGANATNHFGPGYAAS